MWKRSSSSAFSLRSASASRAASATRRSNASSRSRLTERPSRPRSRSSILRRTSTPVAVTSYTRSSPGSSSPAWRSSCMPCSISSPVSSAALTESCVPGWLLSFVTTLRERGEERRGEGGGGLSFIPDARDDERELRDERHLVAVALRLRVLAERLARARAQHERGRVAAVALEAAIEVLDRFLRRVPVRAQRGATCSREGEGGSVLARARACGSFISMYTTARVWKT